MSWHQGCAVAAILGQYNGEYYGPRMMYGGGWWWMWIVWAVGFFLFILLVYFLVYGLRGGRPPDQLRETPLDILKKRYARGEISRAEYEEMKKDLER